MHLRAFVGNIDRWHQMIQSPHNHIELAEQILDESGYTEMWQTDKTPEAPGRLENLKELVKALEQFENLQGFGDLAGWVFLLLYISGKQLAAYLTKAYAHGIVLAIAAHYHAVAIVNKFALGAIF